MEKSEIKGFIAKRCAKELKNGDVVNLGIGLPTLIPNYLPKDVELIIHAELGIVSAGATPKEGDANYDPYHVIDAGGGVASVAYGGGFIDSATNFGLIRGGHVDACFLGALEVDAQGNLANWIIPGKKMPWRLYDENGQAQCDLIAMDGEVIEAGKPVTMVNLDSDAIERTVTFTPTAVKPLLVPHILGGQLAMELPSIAEKKAYIAKQLTEETWESELRLECPHKHYVNMTPAVAECRARMYAELHGGKV